VVVILEREAGLLTLYRLMPGLTYTKADRELYKHAEVQWFFYQDVIDGVGVVGISFVYLNTFFC
jgi:hypothetical protein